MFLFPSPGVTPATVIIPGTSNWTYTTETVGTGTATGVDNKGMKSVETFSGDFNWTMTAGASGGGAACKIGCWPTAEDGTFSASSGTCGMISMTNSVWLNHDYDNYDAWRGSGQETSGGDVHSKGAGDVITFKRVGSTFTFLVDDALKYTWTYTSSATVRFGLGLATATTTPWTSISWTFDE